jgi:hypothetical protein
MSTVGNWRGPNIVKDGLVFYLDAGSPNSFYPPTAGATWKDTSGNGHIGTLTNGPTYDSANGGTIVFDGVDDYVSTNYNTALTDFTVGVWFKSTNVSGYQRVLDKNYTSGFWIGRNTTLANSWGGGICEPTAPYGRFITLTDNQWHYIVFRRLGTTHTVFGDGIINTTSGTVPATALSTSTLALGREFTVGPSVFKGNISFTHMYNRALSDQEILQNFNATRARFGL